MEPLLPRSVVCLVVAAAALAVPSVAQAHSARASIACGTVTFTWTDFAGTGPAASVNTTEWAVTLVADGSVIASGRASFAGTGTSLTTAIPRVNGNVVMSSRWTAAATRDGVSGDSASTSTVTDCSALSSTASAATAVGGTINDVAHLRGVTPDAGGVITFRLYDDRDRVCAHALSTATVPVSGPGDYPSPPVTPGAVGGYQWTTQYSGDARNAGVGPVGCDDPAEHVVVSPAPNAPTPVATVPTRVVPAQQDVCVSATRAIGSLRGVPHVARRPFTARLDAVGLVRMTVYLDGRKLKVLTREDVVAGTFAVRIDPRRLRRGVHRVRFVAEADASACTRLVRSRVFVRPRPAIAKQGFTG